MLEILGLITMGKRIGVTLREKGHNPRGYQILLVVLWFIGEFLGLRFGGTVTDGLGIYLFGLIGAAIGAGITFLIVNSVSPNNVFYQQQPSPTSNYQAPINPAIYQQQPSPISNYQAPINPAIQPTIQNTSQISTAEERLSRLTELRSKNLITEQEFQERRQQILKDL